MRVERFKMEREGLVTEGQEVEISERSAVTGQYTYLVGINDCAIHVRNRNATSTNSDT